MKRQLVLTALASAACAASAQSGVSMYGVMDTGILVTRGSSVNTTQLVSGNLIPSRLGFRGTEDLGGGLSAKFVLEMGINTDTGTGQASNTNNQASGAGIAGASFNRQSWVGLSGRFGEFRLGRDYTPTYWLTVKYDPAFTGGSAASETALRSASYMLPGGARSSNAVVYQTPKFAGFQVDSMYALGENPSSAGATKNDGRYVGARLTYSTGPFEAAVAHGKHSIDAVGDLKETMIGGAYSFAVAKVSGFFTQNSTQSGSDMEGYTLGVSVPLDTNEIKMSFSTSHVENAVGANTGDSRKFALQGIHHLSKRTRLYVVYARVRNSNGASSTTFFGQGATDPNRPASAFSVGLAHSF